jgi:two-component system sensor histidine kinase CreC
MPQEQREQFLQNISAETSRMKLIVEQLLELAALENRRELKDPEPVNLQELIADLQGRLSPKLRSKDLSFETDIRGEVTISGEKALLTLALSNLLDNAVEFSPSGGTIHVEMNHIPEGVECIVEDSGPGVPDYACERVFERFYSLKRPESGKKSSGLGLSIVREVAQLHGGDVALENQSEGGCLARVWFAAMS